MLRQSTLRSEKNRRKTTLGARNGRKSAAIGGSARPMNTPVKRSVIPCRPSQFNKTRKLPSPPCRHGKLNSFASFRQSTKLRSLASTRGDERKRTGINECRTAGLVSDKDSRGMDRL